jgi:hypothetical protein
MRRLLQFQSGASSGQFRILDARLIPGIADPLPFADAWARTFSPTPHQIESVPPGQETATGKLLWIRLEVMIWLPSQWVLPSGVPALPPACPE